MKKIQMILFPPKHKEKGELLGKKKLSAGGTFQAPVSPPGQHLVFNYLLVTEKDKVA